MSKRRVPYAQWVRWIWKLVVLLLLLGLALLLVTAAFPIEGFGDVPA